MANLFVAALGWYFIRTVKRIDCLEEQIRESQREHSRMKFNYLERFDELKDILSKANLEIMQRIAILETKLCAQIKNRKE